MAKQTINPGVAPTGAGGDTFRSGSAKLQANDDELYAAFGASGGVLPAALPVTKGGTGATSAEAARANLWLGSAATRNVGTQAGNLMQVGAFGIGARSTDGLLGSTNLNSLPNNIGFEARIQNQLVNGTTANNYPANNSYGALIRYDSDTHGFQQIYLAGGTRVFARTKSSDTFGAWVEFRTSGNTTVDANGFIKNASPIVKLFSDKIELNDEAKQQSITFERLDTGDYLIKGSSGFAQEGWYIETPKDANGNVLFSVIYTTLENGDISVKTYKKKFDFETVSIVANLDNPVDMTENRWIDLRLQELPQPEIEVTDDPEQ